MDNLLFASPARLLAALLALCLATAAPAQNPSATHGQPAAFAQPAAQTQPAAKPNPNDEMLARANKLYYSTAKDKLDGFDCAVHPDWHMLFVSANKGSAVAESDPRIVLLKTVKITLHARMKGGSILGWDPPATQDKDSTDLLDGMHHSTEETLQGFMQFWTPFVDGSAVPVSSGGLEIAKTETGYTLHAEQNGTTVTETLDSNLILQQFNVNMSGTSVKFAPAFTSTEKGLLVTSFLAHILAAGAPPAQEQEMHVGIGYQTIDGFPIPARLNMEVINSGIFNFVFDGCTVSRQSQ